MIQPKYRTKDIYKGGGGVFLLEKKKIQPKTFMLEMTSNEDC